MHDGRALKRGVAINTKIFRKKSTDTAPQREFTLRIPLIYVLGFSFYLGWVFCLFWSPSIIPIPLFDDFEVHMMRLAMTAGMFLAYALFGLSARLFASRRGEFALRLVALVSCPIGCAVALFPQGLDTVLCCALWAISGMGTSALLLVWSRRIGELNRKQVFFSVSIAFLMASFLFLATAFMPYGIALPTIVSLPLASIAFAFLAISSSLSFSYRKGSHEEGVCLGKRHVDKQEGHAGRGFEKAGDGPSEPEVRSSYPAASDGAVIRGQGKAQRENCRTTFIRTILLAFAYSIGIGFVGSCATVQSFYPDAVYALAAGSGIAAIFTVLFLVRRSKNIAVVLTEVFLPIMLACIFLFSFANHIGQLLCIFIMLALLTCHDIVDLASLSKCSSLFGGNCIRTFAVGRTLNGLGCMVGWATGMALNFSPDASPEFRLIVCFALVVALVAITSFAVFHPGLLTYFREAKIESSYSSCQFVIDGEGVGTLEEKSKRVADRYELTSRQEEVLLCLAQGRNASYIAQKFTISTHTAKSHIYNIYNKLGIHSQQELLDIIEVEGGRFVGASKTQEWAAACG